jgi:hypothetical protein
MAVRLIVDDGQVGAALETLSRAGITVRELVEPEAAAPPPAPAAPLDLFGGTCQLRAPAGTWTRALPGGIAGELAQSAGQVRDYTVWLTRAPGQSIAWSLTAGCEPVELERGECPERLLSALGADELARLVRVATEMLEG